MQLPLMIIGETSDMAWEHPQKLAPKIQSKLEHTHTTTSRYKIILDPCQFEQGPRDITFPIFFNTVDIILHTMTM